MPDVIRLPSIWDYISQAGSAGIENFQDARQRLRQQQMQNAGLTTSLFNQGAIDNTDLMPSLEAVGIKAKINPNAEQKQRQVISSPDVNPSTGKPWTDDELRAAKLPTSAERLASTNAASAETVKAKFLKGEPLTEREARFAGVPTDEELNVGRLKNLGPQADAYIDQTLAKSNGRVPANWNAVVDQAFGAYVADRQRAGMKVDPSDRAYFISQIFERQKEQRQLDIAQQNANANMTSATQGRASAAADRQFAALTGLVESRRKALDDLTSSDPTLALKLQNPKYANDPSVVEYKTRLASYNKAVNAQTQFSGLDPRVAAALHQEAPSVAQPTAAKWGSAQHQTAAQKIISRKATLNDLMPYVKNGTITQADFNAIQQLVAASQRKK